MSHVLGGLLLVQMSRELQAILGSGVRRSAATKYGEKHEFLDNVISPIYHTLKNVRSQPTAQGAEELPRKLPLGSCFLVP